MNQPVNEFPRAAFHAANGPNLSLAASVLPPLTPVEVRMGGRPSSGMRLEELLSKVVVPQPYSPQASWKTRNET